MLRLFSYVVEHDYGFAPNPSGGYCTLAKCKYKKKRRNIVELAGVGDWIVGTGGASLDKSAGHGKLLYAMRVDEKPSLADYYRDERFQGRVDNKNDSADGFALVSRHFFYFGINAIDIDGIPQEQLAHPLEKKGPGFRSDFSDEFIEDFSKWLECTYEVGVHGHPCGSREESVLHIRPKNHCACAA